MNGATVCLFVVHPGVVVCGCVPGVVGTVMWCAVVMWVKCIAFGCDLS